METEKNKTDNKEIPDMASVITSGLAGLAGADLSKLPVGVWEIIKPLLAGAGAMAGSYLLHIKPLQEKIEKMNDKIKELESRLDGQKEYILDLEDKQQDVEKDLDGIAERNNTLFETRRQSLPAPTSYPVSAVRRRKLNI